MRLLHASALQELKKRDELPQVHDLPQNIVTKHHRSFELVDLRISFAEKKLTLPVADRLVNLINDKQENWLISPGVDRRVVLVDGLPKLHYRLDLSFEFFNFGEFRDSKAKLHLPPDNGLNLIFDILKLLLVFLHNFTPFDNICMIPE